MPFSKQLDKILQGKLWRFFGGIKPSGRKSTSHSAIEELAIPSLITLPLDRHLGPDGQLLVNVGDYVKAGQPLTIPGGNRAVPLHASTSGDIVSINMQVLPHASGYLGRCITIKPDGLDAKVPDQPMKDWRDKTPQELLERIRAFGVEGLGGAQFQTAAKIAAALEESKGDCNIFIVNGAECEPVATCDDRLMQEKASDIIEGIEVVRQILKPKVTIVAIEDNKPDAIKAMQDAIKNLNLDEKEVFVRVIPTVYPSGAARNLIKICTGIEIPYDEHTSECGIVVDNVETVFAIKQAVIDGIPLIKRVITVDGQTLGRSGNALVRLGTSVRFVLNAYKLNPERRQRVIVGGPFMGFTLPTIDVPITKSATCIYVPSYKELEEQEQQMNCIRCGRCARVCPSRLAPYLLYAQSRAGQHKQTKESGMMDCTECGCCAYVCPSRIPLSNQFRKEKAILRLLADSQKRNERAQERIAARNERLKKEEEQRKKRVAAARARMALNANANGAAGAAGGAGGATANEQDELAKRRAAAVEAARARAAAKRAAAAKKEEERLAALGKTPAPGTAAALAQGEQNAASDTGAVDNSAMFDEKGNIKVATADDVARLARARAALEAAKAAKAAKEAKAQQEAAAANDRDSDGANASATEDQANTAKATADAKDTNLSAGNAPASAFNAISARHTAHDYAEDMDDDLLDDLDDEDDDDLLDTKKADANEKEQDPVAKAHAMMQQSKDGMLVAAMMNQGGTSAMLKFGKNNEKEPEAPPAPEPSEILPYALRKGGAPKHAPVITKYPDFEAKEKDMSVVENPPEEGVFIPESRPRSKTYLTAPEIIAKKNELPARLRRADYVKPEEKADDSSQENAAASATSSTATAASSAQASAKSGVSAGATSGATAGATNGAESESKSGAKPQSESKASLKHDFKSHDSAQDATISHVSTIEEKADDHSENSAKSSDKSVVSGNTSASAEKKPLASISTLSAYGTPKSTHMDSSANAYTAKSAGSDTQGEPELKTSPVLSPSQSAVKSSFTAKVITKNDHKADQKPELKDNSPQSTVVKPSFGATHVNGQGYKGATIVEPSEQADLTEAKNALKEIKESAKRKKVGFFKRKSDKQDQAFK